LGPLLVYFTLILYKVFAEAVHDPMHRRDGPLLNFVNNEFF